jgi:hypothetical protein
MPGVDHDPAQATMAAVEGFVEGLKCVVRSSDMMGRIE